MTKVDIGSKYQGPDWDRPALRQLPREWVLEEVRETFRPRWYRRAEAVALVILALWLLVGFAQFAGAAP